ncbi:MAG: Trm112 family protein [Pseudomonadota bacterium]
MTETPSSNDESAEISDAPRALDPRMLELLVCPLTKGPLDYDKDAQELVSVQAGLAYPIRDGVPIMLIDEARAIDDDEARA